MVTGAERQVRMQRPRSQEWWVRASKSIPGGISRDQLYGRPPVVIERASGSAVYDVDGNRYIDFVNNYASLIHGHAYPPVIAAVTAQLARGTAYGAANTVEVQLAEALVSRASMPAMVRLVNSGTEAVMLAVQLARHVTGRAVIAKFEGGYHGSYDDVRISVKPETLSGEGSRPQPVAEAGVPAPYRTCVLPFGDADLAVEMARGQGKNWACVVVEPMQGSAGMLPAQERLLAGLSREAKRQGFLLVFDEAITYRLGLGGMQDRYGITPDLSALAKIIGGGLPVGAVVGRPDLLQALAPPEPGRIRHSGTFNGNPLTAAAGCAALDHYGSTDIERLNELGDSLRSELGAGLSGHGYSVTGAGSLMNLHGCEVPPRQWRDVAASDRAAVDEVHHRLRDQGIHIVARGMISLSTAHSAADLEDLARRVVDTCRAVR
jgi:glutamate-1-semialdehyde 2,1-aminomutase